MIELLTKTPASWAERAAARLPELVADHAACELQAAVFALALVGRYPGDPLLVDRLSALATEELRHFRKATREARRLGATTRTRRANPYVSALRAACRPGREPEQGLDLLLAGALVEARSHERFLALVPHLSGEPRLAKLYAELAVAEERHGPAYLELAERHAGREATAARLAELLVVEARALEGPSTGPVAVHSPG
ncbi:MAG: tRNA isopentenyl-2-thiomethyl-A-37 hydroxylase MiaE [Thermoanaerobaculia bacterium]